jgi:hypothetical protein
MRATRAACLLSVVLFSACAAEGPTDPNGGASEFPSFAANIGTATFVAGRSLISASSVVGAAPGSLLFSGSTNAGGQIRTLALGLGRIPGPGTYPLGVNTSQVAGGFLTWTDGTGVYATPLSGAAGTVTITALTADRVTGTFSAVTALTAAPGSPLAITNGRFSVPRSARYVAPSADEAGSRSSATLGASAFNAASITALGRGTADRFFQATTVGLTLDLRANGIAAPGTYSFSPASATPRFLVVTDVNGGSWGGTPQDVGSITITSISARRMTGTFTGTLGRRPGATGAATLTVTNGSFDVRFD